MLIFRRTKETVDMGREVPEEDMGVRAITVGMGATTAVIMAGTEDTVIIMTAMEGATVAIKAVMAATATATEYLFPSAQLSVSCTIIIATILVIQKIDTVIFIRLWSHFG